VERQIPRLVLAGANSGCGKTTVTCAVLRALTDRGVRIGAFKCGPDYIDPMFHSRITGGKSANLDPFFFSENTLRYLLAKNSGEVNIVEGVMGYYDGLGLTTTRASAYEVASVLSSPTVLVVGVKGMSLSALAVLEGFLNFVPNSRIQGVIFNRCSPMTYPALARAVEDRFGGRVRPLGYLPAMPDCSLESRHLGLITADEVEGLEDKLSRLGAQAEKSLDLDGLLDLARSAPPLSYEPVALPKFLDTVRVAVARDRAFCFYYRDSLEALEDMGAELVEFSPLSDQTLPEDIQGLYLGGGYPEVYAQKLSENTSMRRSIKAALEGGLPCVAECGGFMYLTESIEDHPMVGFLPGKCFDTGHLTRFGYVNLTAGRDNLLCRAGESIPAHEFHHWDTDFPGNGFTAKKVSGKSWPCVVATEQLYAGFPHLHFYANPAFGENFYNACLKEKKRHVGADQTHGH
jgi:cobyrinic acid a,c-diamide synthase